jgi:hypothetical protein
VVGWGVHDLGRCRFFVLEWFKSNKRANRAVDWKKFRTKELGWNGGERVGMAWILLFSKAWRAPIPSPGIVGEKVHEPVELGCLWDFWLGWSTGCILGLWLRLRREGGGEV